MNRAALQSVRALSIRAPKLKIAAAIGLICALAACGGGGGGGGGSAGTSDPITNGSGNGNDSTNYSPGTGSGSATLSWVAPSERMNGQAIAMNEIGGYRIYFGPLASPSEYVVEVKDGTMLQYQVTGLAPDTYSFAVSAFDTAGAESSPSNSMTKVIN